MGDLWAFPSVTRYLAPNTDRYYRLAVLPGSADGAEAGTHAHIRAVLQGCGDICRVDMTGTPSLCFDHIEKEVDCQELMANAAIDAPMKDLEPPDISPPEMVDAFTYGGKINVVPFTGGVLNQRYMGNQVRSFWEGLRNYRIRFDLKLRLKIKIMIIT